MFSTVVPIALHLSERDGYTGSYVRGSQWQEGTGDVPADTTVKLVLRERASGAMKIC